MTTVANCADPALYEVRRYHSFISLDIIRFELDDDQILILHYKSVQDWIKAIINITLVSDVLGFNWSLFILTELLTAGSDIPPTSSSQDSNDEGRGYSACCCCELTRHWVYTKNWFDFWSCSTQKQLCGDEQFVPETYYSVNDNVAPHTPKTQPS